MAGVEITLNAFAKLNLYLEVLRRREDGYHDIRSLMLSVDLADTVGICDAPSGISVEADAPGVPSGSENLCWKAADALRRYAGVRRGAEVRLVKRIPAAAGLGGGSSDAASTLVGLNKLWGLGLTEAQLAAVAAGVGSDVPFFLRGGLQLAEARGNRLTPLEGTPAARFVVAVPDLEVSAAWAYGALKMGLTSATRVTRMRLLRTSLDADGVTEILHNDLERGVEESHPVVRRLKDDLRARGALGCLMSGSGPAVFGVVRDEVSATSIASAVRRAGVSTFAVGPVRSGWSGTERA
ncbi:MAG: 4-(cytidine 5'-diphospho)-2-C-methyl-D-erythritol kinase [Candidatus Eisenbacteria bacterium]|nr:4-(cytidine 5'-diphospho)-2-C-methyl-D-erythritol kinase [Candidatus Eisenbacteria bacterium]